MQNSPTSKEIMVQGKMDDMDDMYDGMETESRYTRYGKSRAVNCVQAHSSQRSNYVLAHSSQRSSYQTQARSNLKLSCASQTMSQERK